MRARTTIILVIVALLICVGGWFATNGPQPTAQTEVAAGTLMFPGLAAKLPDAARIEVVHQKTTLAVVRKGDVWGLEDRGGYPVQQDKVRALLTGLAELREMEPRTSDPAEYGRLGVEEPSDPAATSNLLRVLAAGGQPIVSLIVGHRRMRTQGNVPETIYVRRPGEAQAWLAEGTLEVDADPQLWIDRDIADIAPAKIASVSATRDGQTIQLARDGDKLVMKQPADHPKLDDYKLDDVARAFDTLTLTDVKPAAQEPGTQVGTATFTTTDGMAIDVKLFTADKDVWAQFAAHGDGAAKADADKLQARVGGWAYQLGSWKEAALVPSMADLKATEPPPAAAQPAPGATPPAVPAPPAPAESPPADAPKPQ